MGVHRKRYLVRKPSVEDDLRSLGVTPTQGRASIEHPSEHTRIGAVPGLELLRDWHSTDELLQMVRDAAQQDGYTHLAWFLRDEKGVVAIEVARAGQYKISGLVDFPTTAVSSDVLDEGALGARAVELLDFFRSGCGSLIPHSREVPTFCRSYREGSSAPFESLGIFFVFDLDQ